MITEAKADELLAVHQEALTLIRAVAARNWDVADAVLGSTDTRELARVLAMMLVRELKPFSGDSTHQLLASLDQYQARMPELEAGIREAMLA